MVIYIDISNVLQNVLAVFVDLQMFILNVDIGHLQMKMKS